MPLTESTFKPYKQSFAMPKYEFRQDVFYNFKEIQNLLGFGSIKKT